MHDLLVSYLLGEVSDEQRSLVEQRLRGDPEVRRQLDHLRHCMGLDDDTDACSDPPADLAQRTTDRVATVADSGEIDFGDRTFSSLGFATRPVESGESSSNWTVADLTVATGVVLAIGMLLLPALHDSRSASRRLECLDNLRQLGVALAKYSIDNQRYMPPLQNEHAGMFALHLVHGGYVDQDTMSHVAVCPSSAFAEDIRAGRIDFRIPTLAEFNASSGRQRAFFMRITGGSYAYRLGYWQDGEYRSLRNTFSPHVPLMADSPPAYPADLRRGDVSSGNHGGCGENVLFQDQHVTFQVGFVTPEGQDHPYLNHDGEVAPSDDPADTVLARSEVQPELFATDKSRLRFQLVPVYSQ